MKLTVLAMAVVSLAALGALTYRHPIQRGALRDALSEQSDLSDTYQKALKSGGGGSLPSVKGRQVDSGQELSHVTDGVELNKAYKYECVRMPRQRHLYEDLELVLKGKSVNIIAFTDDGLDTDTGILDLQYKSQNFVRYIGLDSLGAKQGEKFALLVEEGMLKGEEKAIAKVQWSEWKKQWLVSFACSRKTRKR